MQRDHTIPLDIFVAFDQVVSHMDSIAPFLRLVSGKYIATAWIPVQLSLDKFSAAVSMNSELKQQKLHMLN